jgi:LPXTG-motif cell wall-anchored protein
MLYINLNKYKRGIEMKKKKGFLGFSLILFLLTCFVFSMETVSAEESLSQLTFEHVSIEKLSKEQQKQFVQGQPQGVVKADKEHFVLVYQPLPVKTSTNGNNSAHLPKTNGTNNFWLMISGLGLVAITLFLLRKKRKDASLLVFILVGSVATTGIGAVAEAATTALVSDIIQTVVKGSQVDYKAPEINGYQYLGYSLTEKNNEAVKPTNNGQVTVSYLDENGNALADSVTLTGAIGTDYQVEEKGYDRYNLVNVTGNLRGHFTAIEQEVTFNYKKRDVPIIVENGTVTYKYQDTEGKTIHPDVTAEGKIGTAIPENQLEIPGYKYKAPANEDSRTFSDEPQEIIYQYQAQGQIAFNLKIHEPYQGSELVNVNDYVMQRLPQGSTITAIQFAKFDNNWQNIEPVPELNGTTFSTLIDGNEDTFIDDMGATFGSITDSKKDDINRLLNYPAYTGSYALAILYDYTDSAGESHQGDISAFSVATNPASIDNLEFATGQEVTIVLTVSIPN